MIGGRPSAAVVMSLLDPLTDDLVFRPGNIGEANRLLTEHHYLGPTMKARLVVVGTVRGQVVMASVWSAPTSRHLPADGSWLELSRWCITPQAGPNAGSRQHGWTVRYMREHMPDVTTLISYSDPSVGHTGSLYRACNWRWSPTWLRLRPPPSQGGSWNGESVQSVKDRWVFPLKRDVRRAEVLNVTDRGAIRAHEQSTGHKVPAW